MRALGQDQSGARLRSNPPGIAFSESSRAAPTWSVSTAEHLGQRDLTAVVEALAPTEAQCHR